MSLGISWGLSFSIMKIAVNSGGEPFSIAFWQAIISALTLLIIVLLKYGKLNIDRSNMPLIILLGFFGSALPCVLFYWTAKVLSAGLLSITVSFIPIITYLLAFILKLEIISTRRVVGILIGAIALNLLIVPENSIPQRSDILFFLVACIAAVSYSIENLLIDFKMPSNIGPIQLACLMNLMGAMMVFPFSIALSDNILPKFPPNSLEFSVLGLGLINALAYSTFIFLVRRTGPVFASQTGYIVTIGGMLWGIFLFNETYSPWVWSSVSLIIFGVILVSPRKAKLKRK